MLLLEGGGHIAELRRAHPSAFNCLWAAPWPTSDPGDPRLPELIAAYGADPAGVFLAGFTGHALCLDLFGTPDSAEAARGVPLHGEAAIRPWTFAHALEGCVGCVDLPAVQLSLERAIALREGSSLAMITETVSNAGPADRDIHWVQHLSLGAPLLAPETSRIFASLDRGRTWPLGYEGHALLPDNTDFAWPRLTSLTGDTVDLRIPFQRPGTGFVAAARVASSIGWVVALNWENGLAFLCCFRRADFPWIAIWEENQARRTAPWNKTAQVRGMEFGTTPMPVGRDAIRALGPLFDTPVSRIVPAHASLHARYAMGVTETPPDLREIAGVEIAANTVLLTTPSAGSPITMPAPGIGEFLLQGENLE